mmetsp:Transcript_90857/g.293359  ORF Transcript_90857/g.293359 Transcript_90857/m.293359 type:complete len:256 (-) Transcript_90857:106-873(-)
MLIVVVKKSRLVDRLGSVDEPCPWIGDHILAGPRPIKEHLVRPQWCIAGHHVPLRRHIHLRFRKCGRLEEQECLFGHLHDVGRWLVAGEGSGRVQRAADILLAAIVPVPLRGDYRDLYLPGRRRGHALGCGDFCQTRRCRSRCRRQANGPCCKRRLAREEALVAAGRRSPGRCPRHTDGEVDHPLQRHCDCIWGQRESDPLGHEPLCLNGPPVRPLGMFARGMRRSPGFGAMLGGNYAISRCFGETFGGRPGRCH